MCAERMKRHGLRQRTGPPQLVIAKPAGRGQAQLQAELRVVAEFRVAVERKMVCQEIDVRRQKPLEPRMLLAHYARLLAPPEIPMMDQEGIGASRDGGVHQGQARRYAGHDMSDVCATLHLESVRTIVLVA